MDIPAVRKRSASDEAFQVLHDWLVSGKLRPGDRLPAQEELAAQLAVSRNTLREAVNKLAALGLLKVSQGRGTVVDAASPAKYITSLTDHLLLDQISLREFLEARILMETASVRLAARRAGPAEIERLKAHLVRQKEAVERGDGEAFSGLDAEFHTELARVSGNGVLLRFLETIWDLLFRFITEVAKLPGAIEDAFKFHQAVTTALAAHETARAEEVMLNHLIDVARRLERHRGIPMAAEALLDLACPSSKPPAGKRTAGSKRARS